MRNRHRGCLGCAIPFFGAVAIYIFVKAVPAGWYMPRRYTSMITSGATAPSSLGLQLKHYIKYDDYSSGVWVVMNKGPALHYQAEVDIAANVKIRPDLSLLPVGVMAVRPPEYISSIMSWDDTIAYEAMGIDGSTRLAFFNGAEVRMKVGKTNGRNPDVLQLEDEDLMLGGVARNMRFGRRLTEAERAFFERENPTFEPCHIPRTCATQKRDADGRYNVTLYTALAEGGISTNVYQCPPSLMAGVTAMGKPEDAYFASFDRIAGPRSHSKVSPDYVKYTIWNRSGVVRVIDVPAGISPEADVCPYEADGKSYIFYLYNKTTERHKVTVGVTFVDLESGKQTEREVTIQIPKDSPEVKP